MRGQGFQTAMNKLGRVLGHSMFSLIGFKRIILNISQRLQGAILEEV